MSLPGGPELLIVLFVVLLIFGSAKLPSLTRSMGQAGREFKAGIKEGAKDGAKDDEQSRHGMKKGAKDDEQSTLTPPAG